MTRKYGISATNFQYHSSKNIESIHKAVLSSTHQFSDQYLKIVLEFLKLPQKHEVEWLRLATEDVKESILKLETGNNRDPEEATLGRRCKKNSNEP